MKLRLKFFILSVLLLAFIPAAFAQGTAFTYQGRLFNGTNAVNGLFDVRFIIWDAASGGSQTAPLTNSPTGVTNGLFTVSLDFGNQFPGASRWLEIAVRPNGGATFTNLSPRQKINPTPYAIFAGNAGTATTATSASSVAAANITGTILVTQLQTTVVTNGASGVNFSGTFSGNGANITNLSVPLSAVNSGGLISWPGNFTLSSPSISTPGPFDVTAADVNGDGKPDLIAANANINNTVTIFTNNGSGGFKSTTTNAVGDFPELVIAADVNGDGKVDLITADTFNDTLTVLTNKGKGTFAVASLLSTGDSPEGMTAADVNGDGKVDLISANSGIGVNALTVLTNKGSGGGFVIASSPGVGNRPTGVAAADVNGDGKIDLISANYNSSFGNTLTVLTNKGSGGGFAIASSPNAGTAPYSVVAADVNSDGNVDLIATHYVTGSNTLVVLINNGSGGFAVSSSPVVGSLPFRVAAADVNGDGKVDLISTDRGDQTLTVLTNNGSANFSVASVLSPGSEPTSVVAADVNGDGRVDLVSSHYFNNQLNVFFNTPIFTGDGSGLTSLNAANLVGPLSATNLVDSIPSAALTSVPAENLTGTIADPRLSANVALLNRIGQTFTGSNVFSQPLVVNNSLSVNDDLTATGVTQFGSGTGTGNGPDKGIITRRAYAIDFANGYIVARTGTLTLVRDGSNGGFKILNTASPGKITIAFNGLTAAGTNVNTVIALDNPGSAGSTTICTDAQNVLYLRGSFGDAYNAADMTEVSLTRFPGDFYWMGTITSTYNQ